MPVEGTERFDFAVALAPPDEANADNVRRIVPDLDSASIR
jgi:hypothetical protein